METRIRTGENLECEYSGKKYPVLIKIYPTEIPSKELPETLWMGRDVLCDALKMVDSLSPPAVPEKNALIHRSNPNPRIVSAVGTAEIASEVAPAEIAPRVKGRNVKDPVEVIAAFRDELVELIKNPPKSRDGEREGLGEIHVRDLIKRFIPTFKNHNAMLPVLQKELGMDRNRFDIIVNMLETERKQARG